MKKLTKNNLNVQNLVRRKFNVQNSAEGKPGGQLQNKANVHVQSFAKHTVAPMPAVVNCHNTLMDIHIRFMDFAVTFREKICEECGWSLPTYYRKMKGAEQLISNAEREKIKSIERDRIQQLMRAAGMQVKDLPGEAA